MSSQQYLLKRRQAWYVRVPVPLSAQAALGDRKEIVRSLKTRDLSDESGRRVARRISRMAFSALSFYFVIIVPLQGYDEPKVSLIQTPSLVRLLLTVHNLAGDLTTRLNEFINYYNTQRYHESLNNLTPEGVSIGRGQTALNRRMRIK